METQENLQYRLKGFLEGVQLQFSLGISEAKQEFEKQKKNLDNFVGDVKSKVSETTEKLAQTEQGSKINSKLEELKLQLALGTADTKDAFEKQTESINNSIKSIKDDLGEKYPDLVKTFDTNTDKLNSLMESIRLQFSLAKSDAQDVVEKNKKDISEKLTELVKMANENKGIAEEKFENFKDEIFDAFNHLKTAVSNLKK